MPFFPLPFRATISRKQVSSDRSGQEIVSGWTIVASPKCLFLATSGNKKINPREEFETSVAFYVEPRCDIEEGDRITDITDKHGNVVEPGPFEVKSVKKVPNLGGSIHHKSCKIVGVA